MASGEIASRSRIFDLANKCFQAFDLYIGCEHARHHAFVRELRSRLAVWDDFAGARAKPGARLDDRLRRMDGKDGIYGMDGVGEAIADSLRLIANNMSYALATSAYAVGRAGSAEDEAASLSEIDVDQAFDHESTKDVLAQLGGKPWGEAVVIIRKLLSLTRAVNELSNWGEESSVPVHYVRGDSVYFEQMYRALVRSRFPSARTTLTDQLGTSLMLRRRRLLYLRDRAKKSHQPKGHSEILSDVGAHATATITTDLRRTSHKPRDVEVLCPEKPFPDADHISHGTCPYCYVPISLPVSDKEWRAHIDKDLQIYLCLSERCSDPIVFFESSDAWLSHMSQEHGQEWTRSIHPGIWYCDYEHANDPDDIVFANAITFETHLSEVHRLARRKIDMHRRRNRRRGPVREPGTCPLCESSTDASSQPPPISSQLFEAELYEHIASHLRAFATISIPACPEDLKVSADIEVSSSDLEVDVPSSWLYKSGIDRIVDDSPNGQALEESVDHDEQTLTEEEIVDMDSETAERFNNLLGKKASRYLGVDGEVESLQRAYRKLEIEDSPVPTND